MMRPRALVLSGYGINCEKETARAISCAGADVSVVHVKAWLMGEVDLNGFDILLFPGGFSFGDALGAAKVFANKILFSKNSREKLEAFIAKGNCILGICNGFQLLVKLGILPGFRKKPQASLIRNERYHFEDRWVHLRAPSSTRCLFTKDIDTLFLPVRHAEGNFTTQDPTVLQQLIANEQIALQYTSEKGESAQHYPDNPNGSIANIAGICDATGRVLGMMPHPEAALFFTHLPDWTRRKEEKKRKKEVLPLYGPGWAIFKNLVAYSKGK